MAYYSSPLLAPLAGGWCHISILFRRNYFIGRRVLTYKLLLICWPMGLGIQLASKSLLARGVCHTNRYAIIGKRLLTYKAL